MEVVERCAGLDIHQRTVVACVMVGSTDSLKAKTEIKTFGTRTCELKELGQWLKEYQVSRVLLESTGQYWVPVWNILEEEGLFLILANPQRIKGTPGRKTDQKDSEWLCQIGRLGLVSRSHVPCKEIQELRYLTRTRTSLKSERTQHKNRIHDVCQRANIKLTSYLSDIFGKTGRALLELAMNGERITTETVAPLVYKRVTASVEELVEALNGCFTKYQLCELRLHFNMMDTIDINIHLLTQAIEEITSKYSEVVEQLQTIPGVKKTSAEVILAEVGADLKDFKTSKHFCSWAGMCPGSYESGGVRRTAHIGKGNKYLKTALYHCARTAAHCKSPTFSSFYQRIASRGSKQLAIIAVGHKILRIIYQIMSGQTQCYQEMGNALV